MRRARAFWTCRAFTTVAAITTTSGVAWRWRITDVDGTELEESDEFFPTITTALAAGRRRLTVREQPDDPAPLAGGHNQREPPGMTPHAPRWPRHMPRYAPRASRTPRRWLMTNAPPRSPSGPGSQRTRTSSAGRQRSNGAPSGRRLNSCETSREAMSSASNGSRPDGGSTQRVWLPFVGSRSWPSVDPGARRSPPRSSLKEAWTNGKLGRSALHAHGGERSDQQGAAAIGHFIH